jgi:ATP-binding cassette subfamily B protein
LIFLPSAFRYARCRSGCQAAIFQMVGDTGWQLSHGERSRIFIARAVMQNPDVLIMDESFAALDPERFRSSVDSLLQRDSALVLITHP